jgi:hypothetical protein
MLCGVVMANPVAWYKNCWYNKIGIRLNPWRRIGMLLNEVLADIISKQKIKGCNEMDEGYESYLYKRYRPGEVRTMAVLGPSSGKPIYCINTDMITYSKTETIG